MKHIFLLIFITLNTFLFGQDTLTTDSSKVFKFGFTLNADAYFRVSSNQTGSYTSPSFKHAKPGLGWINPKVQLSYKNIKFVSDMAYGERQYAFYASIDTLWHSYFKELYMEYTFGEKLHAAVGAYTTHFNFEYNEPGLNAIYTPSLLYTYIQASYSGLRLTYDIADHWNIMLGLYNDNGSNRFNLNTLKHVAGKIAYESETKNLVFNWITGDDIFLKDVLSFEVYADYNFNEKLNIGVDIQNYRGTPLDENVPLNWTGIATYGKFDFNKKWSLGGRAEWFLDKNGLGFGELDNDIIGYTLCGKYKLDKYHTHFVLEYRHDSAKIPIFENLASQSPFTNNQDQVTLSTILQF
jgi:hypothetical protein